MRRRHRIARAWRPIAAAPAVLALAAACAGRGAQPPPVAALASSPDAAAAFSSIREAWAAVDRGRPAELRPMLESFLSLYPRDGRAPFVRVALALAAMQGGDLATAGAQLSLTEGLPAGSTRDFRTVAAARRLRLERDPEGALALLQPLAGKSVDPIVRATFEREIALAALEAHRDYEAVSYMDVWLRASAEDEKAAAVESVTAMVERLPEDVLVGSLQAMRAQRASFGYGVEIERILATRLVRIATTSGDAQLARILLDADPTAISAAGAEAARLGELATSRRGLNLVEGRTVGLLLPTGSPGLRDESADVLRGVMWALGLPRGVRSPRLAPDAGAPAPSPAEPCAPLEDAPDPGEPSLDEGVRLVTRDDAGSADRTEVSLDELVGDGAAVVVAGLDGRTAARALKWGDGHGVPVVVLAAPDAGGGAPWGPFSFVLGESRADVVAALARSAPSLLQGPVAPVADASEVAAYPPQGGPFEGLVFGPPVSCDVPAVRAGDPRFPIAEWEADRTRAWLVSSSPDCADDLLGELSAARARGVVALALEAAALPPHAPSLRVTTIRAGAIPMTGPDDPRADELRRFSAALGRTGWWSALGRDAAVLSRVALLKLPTDSVSDPRAVAERRVAARDALAQARARLWTTEASGWSADRSMKRTLCTLDAPGRGAM